MLYIAFLHPTLNTTIVDRKFRREPGASQAAERRVPEGAGGFSPRNECEITGPSGPGLSCFHGREAIATVVSD